VLFLDFSSPEKPVNFLSFRHFLIYLFNHREGNKIRRQGERTSKEAHCDQLDGHILAAILTQLWKAPSQRSKNSITVHVDFKFPITRLIGHVELVTKNFARNYLFGRRFNVGTGVGIAGASAMT
jgi:hypothetical protein